MAIGFPNQARSYDALHGCVRFWGSDGAMEVSFLVEDEALARIDPETRRTEAGFLTTFDDHRDRIQNGARKAHGRRKGNFYKLGASDF